MDRGTFWCVYVWPQTRHNSRISQSTKGKC